MKVHIKFITLIMCAVLVINNIILCSTVYAAAAPGIGIPVGVGIPVHDLPDDIYKGFKDALNMFVNDIFGGSSSFSYEDYDGATKTVTSSAVKAQCLSIIDSGKVMYDANGDGKISLVYYDGSSKSNRFVDLTLDEYSKFLSTSDVVIGVDDYNGENVVSFFYSTSVYDSSLKNVQSELLVGSGASSGVSWGLDMINGVPHNSITVNQDFVVSVFDFLGLDYKMYTSSNDLFLNIDILNSEHLETLYYTPFFITENNDLYIFYGDIKQEFIYRSSSIGTVNRFSTPSYNYYFSPDFKGCFSFRFFTQDTNLYFGLLSSYGAGDKVFWNQCIIGDPEISYTPILFEDRSSSFAQKNPYDKVTNLVTNKYSLQFFKAYNGHNSTKYNYSDILNEDVVYCGYFYGTDSTARYITSNIKSAGQMLLGTENAISGGGQSVISSELSDWQKAIYMLAQQQGMTYEELLQKLDMIIDSQGNLTIVGADGIEYKVDELSKTFDEVYSKVDDIATSTTELLEYLKSLNIEGLGSHIAELEGTLNDLNERDKEREAVYGDMLGKLEELNNRVGSLNLDDLKSISTDISNIKGLIQDGLKVGEIDIDDIQNNLEASIFIEKFPFSLPFDLYRLITLFVREPVEPVFKVPIKTEITAFGLNESIDEEITLDLTMFKVNGVDIVRVVLNFSITVGFIVMLIKSTTKLFV